MDRNLSKNIPPFDISNPFSPSFPPKVLLCEGNYYAFSPNGFYVKDLTNSAWKRIETPFPLLDGMSVTVCGKVIVFFGGIKSSNMHLNTNLFRSRARTDVEPSFSISSSSSRSYSSHLSSFAAPSLDYIEPTTDFAFYILHKKMYFTNEMWIYDNGTWVPIYNDLEPVAYHSACYLPYNNSICFIGGCKANKKSATKKPRQIGPDMLPPSLKSVENYELLNRIAIFNLDKFSKTSFEPVFKGDVSNMQATPNTTKTGNISSRALPLGCAACYYQEEKIIFFGGKQENGENLNNLYICDIPKKSFYEYEPPIIPIDKFFGESFITDNKLFVFSGFTNNVFSDTCWIYDFDHLAWIFYDISKSLPNASFLVKNAKGAIIFNNELTDSIDVNFNDDIISFISKIIDEYNINSNIYNTDYVTEYCANLFKSCTDNFSTLVSKCAEQKESEEKQKSENSSEKKSKKDNEFTPLIDMIKEYNSLQFSCFKLDERITLNKEFSKSHQQDNDGGKQESIPDVNQAIKLMDEYRKLKENNNKTRNDLITKSKELAANLDKNVEQVQEEMISSVTNKKYQILPPFNEKREMTSVIELCSEIEEQEKIITSLRKQLQEVSDAKNLERELITDYYNIDNLALISKELQHNVHQQQIDRASQIVDSNKKWIDFMETVSNSPPDKKQKILKTLRRISYKSKLQNWDNNERDYYAKMNQKLLSSFKKLKKGYINPTSEKETSRMLSLQKNVYDAIDAISQRTDLILKYPPSETDYWDEVYSNIVRTSILK